MKHNHLKIISLSIWWGVFTFYSGVVVPVGMTVLGSHTKMGFVTQEVSKYLKALTLYRTDTIIDLKLVYF